jgi:hypothetical protein
MLQSRSLVPQCPARGVLLRKRDSKGTNARAAMAAIRSPRIAGRPHALQRALERARTAPAAACCREHSEHACNHGARRRNSSARAAPRTSCDACCTCMRASRMCTPAVRRPAQQAVSCSRQRCLRNNTVRTIGGYKCAGWSRTTTAVGMVLLLWLHWR